MELEILMLLAMVAFAAGVVDSMAGGGGDLITVPVLLSLGLPPSKRWPPTKPKAYLGAASAAYYWSQGLVQLKTVWPAAVCALIGGVLGGALVQSIDASIMQEVIPFMLIGFSYFCIVASGE